MISGDKQRAINKAVQILQEGGLVAIPTETVYGLAADATNKKAVQEIYKVKGRPEDHPLILHIADNKDLPKWAIEIPEKAYKLTSSFGQVH